MMDGEKTEDKRKEIYRHMEGDINNTGCKDFMPTS